jgi:glycosyltransferase involved in cell wall biosynthesis
MEGFGLPPLEAMARRRPVIASDIPVFRELYGRHALFVDTEDPSSWEEALAALQSPFAASVDAAQQHALSYNSARMATSLKEAIQKFWDLSRTN